MNVYQRSINLYAIMKWKFSFMWLLDTSLIVWCNVLRCLLVSFVIILCVDSKVIISNKKCIIFVPGVGGSGLFYKQHDNKQFQYGQDLFMRVGGNNIVEIVGGLVSVITNMTYYDDLISCDVNGKPSKDYVGALDSCDGISGIDRDIYEYGVFLLFKDIIQMVRERFGEKYDVTMFSYDWRLDCNENSERLADVVKKYDKVVLVGHSMGGLISVGTIKKLLKTWDLRRIKAYISVCVPYNGSIGSVFALTNGFMTVSEVVNSLMSSLGYSVITKNLMQNYMSIYQLIPHTMSSNNDSTLKELEKNDMFNMQLFNRKYDFYNSTYAGKNNVLKHINNKYYFCGVGIKTPSEIMYKSGKISFIAYEDGDGTVSVDSSLLPVTDGDKVFKINGLHSMMFINAEFQEKLLDILRDVCKD